MVFMLCATLSSMALTFKNNVQKLMAGTGSVMTEGLQCVIIIPVAILAILLVIEGVSALARVKKEKAASK